MSNIVQGMPITEFNDIQVNTSILSSSSNYYKYSSRQVKYIVMHYTGNSKDTALANAKYFNSGSRSASAHYFVDNNSCYQSVALNNAAWAVGGTSKYKHPDCRNLNSISIEMCCSGNYIVSDKTINNAAYLCAKLCELIGITYDTVDTYVLRHYDVWDKSCPAQWAHDNSSDWDNFKRSVKNILKGSEDELMSKEYEELKQLIVSKDEIINTMGQEISEGKAENAKLKARIEKLENPMIYDYIDKNMPQWAHESVQWCVNNGLITGTGDGLGLNNTKLWVCVVLHRAIKYIAKLINVKI